MANFGEFRFPLGNRFGGRGTLLSVGRFPLQENRSFDRWSVPRVSTGDAFGLTEFRHSRRVGQAMEGASIRSSMGFQDGAMFVAVTGVIDQ